MRSSAAMLALCVACTTSSAPRPAAPKQDATPDAAAISEPDASLTDANANPPAVQHPVNQPTRLPLRPGQRLIAIGDVHGDYEAMRRALILAGLIDEFDRWIGGEAVLVQVGDQLDRGNQERRIIDELERLAKEAHAAGGGVFPLLGNHETMNVSGDFRYVTLGGWSDFADLTYDDNDPVLQQFAPSERGRVHAFRPGGPYAKILSRHNVIMIVGDTIFAHGGVLPSNVDIGLEAINEATRTWMLGGAARPPVLSGDDSPVWSRHYSDDTDAADCALLQDVLQRTNTRRIVVAHTVQLAGVNAACDDKAWRVDVGLAAHYGGTPEALEIIDGVTRIIR